MKYSWSKLLYEPDAKDYELRKKLLESKMARKKTEEDPYELASIPQKQRAKDHSHFQ